MLNLEEALLARLASPRRLESPLPGAKISNDSIYEGRWSLLFSMDRLGGAWRHHREAALHAVTNAHDTWKRDATTAVDVATSFLHGSRGRLVLGCDGGVPRTGLGPPTYLDEEWRGDSFVNDHLLLFHAFPAPATGPRADLLAWKQYLVRELAWATRTWSAGHPHILGFGHGLAGLLFTALWFDRVHGLPARSKERATELLYAVAGEGRENGRDVAFPHARGGPASLSNPLLSSFCCGLAGLGTLFAEGFKATGDERLLDLAAQAARTSGRVANVQFSGFCCGAAGVVALVSRLLRLGCKRRALGPALGLHKHLKNYILMDRPRIEAEDLGFCGASSCLAVVHAEDPSDPLLDFFLPPIESYHESSP